MNIKDLLRTSHLIACQLCAIGFNRECLSTFYMLKEALILASIIQPLDSKLLFEVMCDASDYGFGAILGEKKDDKPYAIYYVC